MTMVSSPQSSMEVSFSAQPLIKMACPPLVFFQAPFSAL
jgi:hypothetical protein